LKTFALIPARRGSKGIGDKNLQEVGGITLVSRTIHYALNSASLDGIIVSTDSPIIISESRSTFRKLRPSMDAEDFNLEKLSVSSLLGENGTPALLLHRRSTLLAQDRSLIADTLEDLYLVLSNKFPGEDVYLLLLQPTTPFRGIEEIDGFLAASRRGDSYAPCVSVTKVDDFHPSRMYRASDNVLHSLGINPEDEFSPRQDLETIFIRDGGYYLVTPSMAKQKIPVQTASTYFIREFPYSLNIDSPVDLALARSILEKKIWEDNL